MSTKTLRKRVALVAVAALGFGVVTGVSANAADGDYYGVAADTNITGNSGSKVVSGASSQNASVSAVIGKYVTINFKNPNLAGTDSTSWSFASTGSGALFGTVTHTDSLYTAANNLTDSAAAGGLFTSVEGDNVITFLATSAVAGLQSIAFTPQNGDAVTATLTINWLAEAAAAINSANTVVYADADACAYDTGTARTRTVALAAQTADSITSIAKGSSFDVCVLAYDGNGDGVTGFATNIYTSLGGAVTDATSDHAIDSGAITPAVAGKATVTVTLTKGSAVVVKTFEVSVYGSMKTLSLSNATFSALKGGTAATNLQGGTNAVKVFDSLDAGSATANDIGTPGSSDGALVLTAKDSNGALADLSGTTTSIAWTVDSDAVNGAPAAGTSDSFATLYFNANTTVTADLKSTHLGGNGVLVRCGATAEKLTITAAGYDSTGASVKSSPVTFYCAGAVDKVAVTGTASTVNVKITDANGYPVADGTSVTLAASNGSVVAPTTKTTSNGEFATAATFIPTSTASTSAVTAIVGSKSGVSAAIAGTGSASTTDAQIASLISKINALSKLIAKIQKKLGIK